MGRSRIAGALMALAACSGGAGATALDKSACNELKTELAGIIAAGARNDMERGPQWAMANLPPEKLERINRLIVLEEQLEFRCGIGHSRVVTIEAEPPKGPAGKVVVPEGPEKKPAAKTNPAKPPQALNKAVPKKAAAAAPPKLPALATVPKKPPVAVVTAPKPPAAAATVAKPIAAPIAAAKPAPPPVGGTMQTATTEAPPESALAKPSRRQSSAGYVSPTEVNPFFVTRYGDTR
jgi:hypothetical protein